MSCHEEGLAEHVAIGICFYSPFTIPTPILVLHLGNDNLLRGLSLTFNGTFFMQGLGSRHWLWVRGA